MDENTSLSNAPRARLTVEPAQTGFRADRALATLLPDCGRRGAKSLFHAGQVRLNGKISDGSERVQPGDLLECPDPTKHESRKLLHQLTGPRLTTQHGRQVGRLYEDDDLMVLSKPAEIPVHRNQDGHNRRETLEDVLERAFPPRPGTAPKRAARSGEGEEDDAPVATGLPGFYFAHRLDMETTGCILVAKHEESRDKLIRAFQERRIEKEYLAIVVGEVSWEEKTIRRSITYRRSSAGPTPHKPGGEPDWARLKKFGKRPSRFIKMGIALDEGDPKGKTCETKVSVIERFRGYTLLRCEPKTGRMHQIRVHLAAEGFPLAYDIVYGRKSPLRMREFNPRAAEAEAGEIVLNRLPLHARRLAFPHPKTGERTEVEAPLPNDLREFIRLLRKYRANRAEGRDHRPDRQRPTSRGKRTDRSDPTDWSES
jgi:23S rRNA pseudouridine1911/1915/1917 synthase